MDFFKYSKTMGHFEGAFWVFAGCLLGSLEVD